MVRTLALIASLLPAAALASDAVQNTQSWWAPDERTPSEPREATVAELAQQTKAKAAVPIDANGNQTRAREGVIPGAVLLSSSSTYELKELPADKASQLVFYCASERCTASHQAARRAIASGYTNVAVLSAGIKGWKAAGQPTAKPPDC